jgi:hypothetical protein
MIGCFLRASNEELASYLNDSGLLEERLDKEDDDRIVDIEKSWESIQYILTGCATFDLDGAPEPLRWVIFGEYLIDENQDLGYGPAHYCTTERVKEIALVLNGISTAEFHTLFTGACARWDTEMYPSGFQPDESWFDYFNENFERLKQLYSQAAQNEETVITYIG